MQKYFKTPALVRKLLPGAIWKLPGKQTKPTVYLTFDDGPVPGPTPWVLNQLSDFKAKATFFSVGDNIIKYPDIFQEVIREEHQIGNHTFHHLNGWKTPLKQYVQNIIQCQEAIETYYPLKTALFRPPYGKINFQQWFALSANWKIIYWDILSYDFDATFDRQECLHQVISNVEDGSIVVFHDSHKAMKNLGWVLPRFLEYCSQKGFEFNCLPS